MRRLPLKDWLLVGGQFALFALYLFVPALYAPALPLGLAYAGAALAVAGVLLLGLALLQLNRHLSPFPTPISGNRLRTQGAYGLARHPIYAGILWTALGYAVFAPSLGRLLVTAALALWFYYKSRYEEQLLQQRHPGYAEYRRRVRRFG